jgi:hypothetical protein
MGRWGPGLRWSTRPRRGRARAARRGRAATDQHLKCRGAPAGARPVPPAVRSEPAAAVSSRCAPSQPQRSAAVRTWHEGCCGGFHTNNRRSAGHFLQRCPVAGQGRASEMHGPPKSLAGGWAGRARGAVRAPASLCLNCVTSVAPAGRRSGRHRATGGQRHKWLGRAREPVWAGASDKSFVYHQLGRGGRAVCGAEAGRGRSGAVTSVQGP